MGNSIILCNSVKRKHSIIKLDFLSTHKRDCSTTTSYLHFQQNGNGNKNQTHANYKEEDVVASMKRSRRKEARVISFKLRRPSLLGNSYIKTIFVKNHGVFIKSIIYGDRK